MAENCGCISHIRAPWMATDSVSNCAALVPCALFWQRKFVNAPDCRTRKTNAMYFFRIIWTQIIRRRNIFATNSAPNYNFRSIDFKSLITKLHAQYFQLPSFLYRKLAYFSILYLIVPQSVLKSCKLKMFFSKVFSHYTAAGPPVIILK